MYAWDDGDDHAMFAASNGSAPIIQLQGRNCAACASDDITCVDMLHCVTTNTGSVHIMGGFGKGSIEGNKRAYLLLDPPPKQGGSSVRLLQWERFSDLLPNGAKIRAQGGRWVHIYVMFIEVAKGTKT